MSRNVVRFQQSKGAKPALNLPDPRVWKPQDLSAFLGVSVHWVYKRCERKADDPIPRIPGIGRLRFDTHHPDFQDWMRRQLGYVDMEAGCE